MISLARAHSLAANGLQPDGSLDPAPDPWTTLAALPPWGIVVVAVLEVALVGVAGLLLLGLFVVAITHL